MAVIMETAILKDQLRASQKVAVLSQSALLARMFL